MRWHCSHLSSFVLSKVVWDLRVNNGTLQFSLLPAKDNEHCCSCSDLILLKASSVLCFFIIRLLLLWLWTRRVPLVYSLPLRIVNFSSLSADGAPPGYEERTELMNINFQLCRVNVHIEKEESDDIIRFHAGSSALIRYRHQRKARWNWNPIKYQPSVK